MWGFGLFAQCEAYIWGVTTGRTVTENAQECRLSSASNGSNTSHNCPFRRYDRVFIMTQYDDTQIGQFILEAMPKLIYHLNWLRNNPDVKIHYGFSKLPTLPPSVLPNGYLDWLGLGDRLVNGTMYAKEVYMPREGGCQEPTYNAWELLHQREYLLRMAKSESEGGNGNNGVEGRASLSADAAMNRFSATKRTVLVIKRTAGQFSQNLSDRKVRMWPERVLESLLEEFGLRFPLHDVVVFADNNRTLMTCPLCQVRMFDQADVVVGIHGAGLTNTLYMRPGSIVIEVIPKYFDSRHAPAIGIFPRLAAMVGLHHYLYYLPELHFEPKKMAEDAMKYAKATADWTL